ncbi:MAG: hypothetical protein AAFW73_26275 [Bacteroidota bacterium]
MQRLHHTRSRKLLTDLRTKAGQIGLPVDSVRPHRLLLYAPLLSDDSAIEFALDRRQGERPLEIRLDENDAFLCHAAGLALHGVPIIGGRELPAIVERLHYPDPNVFNGPAIGGVTELQSLEMVYNGLLQIETEQDIRLKQYDTSVFRTVPEVQKSATTVPQTCENAIKDLDTAFMFYGGSRNDIRILLNSAGGNYAAISGVADTRVNYAVLILEGIIMTGASKKATAGAIHKIFRG